MWVLTYDEKGEGFISGGQFSDADYCKIIGSWERVVQRAVMHLHD